MDNNEIMVSSTTSDIDLSTYLDNQAYLPFAGGGRLNLHNGEVKYEFTDTNVGGVAFPFELRHIFNKLSTVDNYYGKYWNLSVNRRMWYYTESSGIPFYENEYGETIYFVGSDDPNVYEDVCNLDMKFYSYTDEGLMLVDKLGSKMFFDYNGWLSKMTDVNGNYILIERSGDRPTKIRDSFGRTTEFTYSNGLLSRITDSSCRAVEYEYDNTNHLVRVVWQDGADIVLTYTNNRLTSIKDIDGTITVLKYEENEENDCYGRGIRIEKYPAGSDISIYSCEDYTDISYVPKLVDFTTGYERPGNATVTFKSGINKAVYFDVDGRPTFIYEYQPKIQNGVELEGRKQIVGSTLYKYQNRRRNYVSSVIQDEDETNLLEDGSFEEYSTDAPTWQSTGLTAYDNAVSSYYVDGNKSFYFSTNKLNGLYNKMISQTVPGSKLAEMKGEYLTLSGWAMGSVYYASLSATVTYSDNSTETKSVNFGKGSDKWSYEELPIKINKEKTVDNIVVSIKSTNQSTYRFDNIRLVNSPVRYSELGDKYSVEEDGDVDHRLSQFTGKFVDALVTVFGKTMTIDETIDSFDGINKSQLIKNTSHDVVREKITDGEGNCFCNYYEYDNKHQLIYSQDYRGIITKYTYNSVGMVTSVKSWYCSDMNPSTIAEPTEFFLKTMTYDETGEFLIRENDPRGDYIYTTNEYDTTKCLLQNTTAPNGQKTSYTYDPNNDLVTMVSAMVGENEYSVLYGYTNRRLTSITHNGFNYGFTYDGMGRLNDVKIAGETYSTNDYLLTDTTTVTTTYATGEKMRVETDKFDRPAKTTYIDENENATILSETEYDSLGRVTKSIDNITENEYNYKYDGFGNITEKTEGVLTSNNVYDSNNRLVEENTVYDDYGWQTARPIYDKNASGKIYPDNAISGMEYDDWLNFEIEKDVYGRVVKKSYSRSNESEFLSISYEYYNKPEETGTRLTNLVKKQITRVNGGIVQAFYYYYDINGNIGTVEHSDYPESIETQDFGVTVENYEYDGMNQLIREDNRFFDETVLCT
ncbi:MAG: hypothetical protein IKK94_07885, partial [Clostridia bacterium]|nr:hypothetical protein [Clostridia bacterium]